MTVDIAAAINDLLYINRSVVIPGFGGFTSDYKAASVDYVQGNIAPPSKKLTFNPNLKINDGVMIAYLQKEYDISVEEAQQAIDDYIGQVQQILDNKEIVGIPKVGRLYLDYEKKLKFLPEGTNFSPDSFGLPTVNYYPVMRDKSRVAQTPTAASAGSMTGAAAATTPPTPNPSYNTTADSSLNENWWLWAILGAAVIMLVVSTCLLVSDEDWSDRRVNTSPIIAENDGDTDADLAEDGALDDPEDMEDFAMDDTEVVEERYDDDEIVDEVPAQEGNNYRKSPKKAFVIINSFGVRDNARKQERELNRDGYNALIEKDGGLYRVGVDFRYTRPSELTDIIEELSYKYSTQPIVWEGGVGRKN